MNYLVTNHLDDFDTAYQETEICVLGKLDKYEAKLTEICICGFHFLFVVSWGDWEREFLSAATAIRWFEAEQERRKKAIRAARADYQRRRYWINHTTFM